MSPFSIVFPSVLHLPAAGSKLAQPFDLPELLRFAVTRFRYGSTHNHALPVAVETHTHTHTHTKSWGRTSCSAPSDQQADGCVGCLNYLCITVRQTKGFLQSTHRNLVAQWYETAKVTVFGSTFQPSSGQCKHTFIRVIMPWQYMGKYDN
jgi:hypothetical protein